MASTPRATMRRRFSLLSLRSRPTPGADVDSASAKLAHYGFDSSSIFSHL